MKHFLYLSFAALLLASCAGEVKEPSVKKPAPPPTVLVSNTVGNGTPTFNSSVSGATITVDSPNETGVVTYYNTSGCARASFEAVLVGSTAPLAVQITTRSCDNASSTVYVPTSTVQYYNVGNLNLVGGALQIMIAANSNGNYASVQIRNLTWY